MSGRLTKHFFPDLRPAIRVNCARHTSRSHVTPWTPNSKEVSKRATKRYRLLESQPVTYPDVGGETPRPLVVEGCYAKVRRPDLGLESAKASAGAETGCGTAALLRCGGDPVAQSGRASPEQHARGKVGQQRIRIRNKQPKGLDSKNTHANPRYTAFSHPKPKEFLHPGYIDFPSEGLLSWCLLLFGLTLLDS